jgi:hypothetical protein
MQLMRLDSALSKLTLVPINRIMNFFYRLYGKPEELTSLIKISIIFKKLWQEQRFKERVPR